MNLPRRLDRRLQIEELLSEEGLPYVVSSDLWGDRFDARVMAEELRDASTFPGWEDPRSANCWWSRPLKWGEVGCALAHAAIWSHAAQAGRGGVVILEDDVCFQPGILKQLAELLGDETLPEWGLLYLGRVPIEPDRRFREGLVWPGYSHCSFAYVLSRLGLVAVVEADLPSAVIPVDEFLPAMFSAHPRKDVRARFRPRFSALALDPPVVTQLDKETWGSDTEDSEYYSERSASQRWKRG